VTLSATTPIQGGGAARFVNVEGLVIPQEDRRYVSLNWVAPRYFETLGTPVVAGRDFARDDAGRAPVAIVNEAMARRYFGDRSALGRRFSFDEVDRVYEIIGVVADAKYIDLHQPAPPTVYLHALQEGRGAFSDLTLHTIGPPLRVLPEVRSAVGQTLGDRVRIATARTMADQMDATLVPERLMAWLSVWFGVLGATLAAIGVYGRLSYAVKRRTAEIGVRMALGATRRSVVAMVLGSAGVLVGTGVVVGLPLALLGTRAAARVLPDTPPAAVPPIAAAAILMTLVALTATALPALGAARIDPVTALRRE
jgi:hypothetical protein